MEDGMVGRLSKNFSMMRMRMTMRGFGTDASKDEVIADFGDQNPDFEEEEEEEEVVVRKEQDDDDEG